MWLSTPEVSCSAITLKIAKDLSSDIADSMSCIVVKSLDNIVVLSSNDILLQTQLLIF
jgi:hypothetical protein